MARAVNPYGDGLAAERIAAWLLARLRGGDYPAEFSVRESGSAAAEAM
jgi:UDP-N-acetylglucosamine 2-epimerase